MSGKIAIAWTDLTVSVKSTTDKKIILNNICGKFEFNSINALMGSSGSGKTTLLKCFNEINNKYSFSDNSCLWIPRDIEITKCFIYQNHDQRVMTGLSVRQALTYASKLKNSDESGVNHKEIVNQVMSELLISDIENNLVEKCSGGEVKRFCIALELTALKKPNILFLDEPTTGLDSNAAEVLIGCLRGLSRLHRMSIITSIHQPNNDLFLMFDSVYVLAKGGVCLYSGLPQKMRQHLNECQIECNENQIPIEVIIKLSFNGINDKSVRQLAIKTHQKERRLDPQNMIKSETGLKTIPKGFRLKDFWYLLLRFLNRNYVSQRTTLMKIISTFSLITLLLVNCVDQRVSKVDGCFQPNITSGDNCLAKEEEKSIIYENLALYNFLMSFLGNLIIVIQTNSFVADLKIFRTEHKNRWYSSGVYWLAKFFVESSIMVILTVVFFVILEFYIKISNDYFKLALFFYIYLITFLIINCIAFIIGTLCSSNNNIAVILSIFTLVLVTNYSNSIYRVKELPEIIQYLSMVNYGYYNFNSVLILIYGLDRCLPGQLSRVLIEYDQEDDHALFWKYIHYFLVEYLVLVIMGFLVFLLKVRYSSIKCFDLNLRFFKRGKTEINGNQTIDTELDLNSNPMKNEVIPQESEQITKHLMISWIDLTFTIRKRLLFKTNSIQILNKISGSFESNTLNAIMGPSGAGKSTLIKCLNGKHFNGLSNESKIFVTKSVFKSCFIVQNTFDHLLEGLTVRQTLLYASKLKNSRIAVELDHNQIVSDLMSELLISDTAENRVESCSGGEQKRVVIASELTSYIKPNILFIDEPTSGLDSNAAEVVVDCLKRLSRRHRMSVIISIHQPNTDLFFMFDSVYVLAKGGVCVYSGLPQDLRQHLNNCEIDCDQNQSPIEVLLKVSADRKSTKTAELLMKTTKEENKQFSEEMRLMYGRPNTLKPFTLKDFYQLLLRTMNYTYRCQWKTFLIQLIMFLLMGITMKRDFNPKGNMIEPDGCLKINLTQGCVQTVDQIENEELIQLNLQYNMALLIAIAFMTLLIMSISFCKEYRIFRNEHNNGWYSTGAFLLAKNLVDTMPQFFIIGIFCWIINLYSDPKIYFLYYFMNFFIILCTHSVAQIGALISPENTKISVILSLFFHCLAILLGNHIFPIKHFHYSLQTLSSLSYIRLGFESLLIIIYGFDRCPKDQISGVLYTHGLESRDFWPKIFSLIIVTGAFKLITLFVLLFRTSFSIQVMDNSKNIDRIKEEHLDYIIHIKNITI